MGTYNRRVKFGLKIPNHSGKVRKPQGGGDFFTHTVCPTMHHWCKSGENPSNTFQDIKLTKFQDARINKTITLCVSSHNAVIGDIKVINGTK